MNKLKEYVLPTLIALCAISVSASAAIYSVSGLAKLFAGASLQVMIMAGSLEVAKLVIATLLHQYWKTLNKLLKVYLTLSVMLLVLITSMGIYGFLSSAYQNTAIGFQTASKEVAFLKQREAFYQKDLDRLDTELNRISDNVSELSKAKAREVTVSDGRGGTNTTVSTTELRLADSRIRAEEVNRATTLASRNVVADSLKNIQTKILRLEVEASSNAELGPLIYLSELTGRPMDQIINILLLVIIFVFDPLAISLVIAANFAFAQLKGKEMVIENNIKEQKNIILAPSKAKPNFDYSQYSGFIYKKGNFKLNNDNEKKFRYNNNFSECLMNTGNYVINKYLIDNLDITNELKLGHHLNSPYDVIYLNTLMFEQLDLNLHVVKNLEYEHIVHDDSTFIKTNTQFQEFNLYIHNRYRNLK